MTVEAPQAPSAIIVSEVVPEDAIISEGDGHFKEQQLATQTEAVGIINPPPDIRSIVDKTAQFVSRNGTDFEKRILANEKDNVKFQFLQPTSPFHAYYQFKIAESKAADATPAAGAGAAVTPTPAAPAAPPKAAVAAAAMKAVGPPAAEMYTVHVPAGLAMLELDLIRLTAQYVARNGKEFLTGLMSRESSNPQFGFLKPTHSLFSFFTAMADAYSKVLMPPKGTMEKLMKDAADVPEVLKRCLHRLEWDRTQQRIKKEEEDRLEEERQAMGSIDWHDFVVAETIQFDAGEEEGLPEPLAPRDLVAAVKREIYGEEQIEEEEQAAGAVPKKMSAEDAALMAEAAAAQQGDDMDMDMEEEEEVQMKIVRNYKRPDQPGTGAANAAEAAGYVISPITGEKVAMDQMAEHMRISLIDPKFKQQRDAMMAKLRNSTMAQDDEIGRNIMRLAKTRPDVFASTDEELGIALKGEADATKKLLEESGPGPQGVPFQMVQNTTGLVPLGGSGGASASQIPGMQAAGGSLEAQIAAIHAAKQKGQLPSGVANLTTGTLPPLNPMPPPPKPPVPPATSLPPPMPLRPLGGAGAGMPPPLAPPPGSLGGPPASGPPPIGLGMPPPPAPPPMSGTAPALGGGPPGTMPAPVSALKPLGGGGGAASTMPPPPGPPPPPSAAAAPRPPPVEQPQEQPEAKRARMDEGVLLGEEEFAAAHAGPQTISVSVMLSAEPLSLEVPVESVTWKVSELKAKLATLTGTAANKQKLATPNGAFMRDNETLAFYNCKTGTSLTLTPKQRGKK